MENGHISTAFICMVNYDEEQKWIFQTYMLYLLVIILIVPGWGLSRHVPFTCIVTLFVDDILLLNQQKMTSSDRLFMMAILTAWPYVIFRISPDTFTLEWLLALTPSNLKGEKLAWRPFKRFSEAADISSHFSLNFTDNFHPCHYFREFLFRTWMNQSAICKS